MSTGIARPYRKLLGVHIYRISGIGVRQERLAHALGEETGAPPDMLRYDVAFQNWTEFPDIIALPSYTSRNGGRSRGTTTDGRWRSFCINVSRVTADDSDAIQRSVRNEPEKWISYRHSAVGYELERVTWQQFFSETKQR